MSGFRHVRVESESGGIRVLVLDRPPVNALGRELVEDLERALASLAADDEARCLVVRSAGKHFCAGADLKERRGMSVEDVRAFVPRLAGICDAIADVPYPTIAAIRGVAAGGGCEIALACDVRVIAEDAKIGLRETALAIIPGAGGTQRLPRLVGPSTAKRWIFSARMFGAAEAASDGVVDRVAPPESVEDEALDLAKEIAANGPVALRLAKRAIDGGLHLPLRKGLELEWACYQEVLGTEDREEALRAFAEKRPPRFRGR